jgi:hypothetical protein
LANVRSFTDFKGTSNQRRHSISRATTKFLVDGWTWSVDQAPISIKAIAPAIGKYLSGVVGGYREFIRGLVAMLHLPRLPQSVYDASGIAAFSIGRGVWIGRKVGSAINPAVICPQ